MFRVPETFRKSISKNRTAVACLLAFLFISVHAGHVHSLQSSQQPAGEAALIVAQSSQCPACIAIQSSAAEPRFCGSAPQNVNCSNVAVSHQYPLMVASPLQFHVRPPPVA